MSNETHMYEEIAWVSLDEWPLEDSPDGQHTGNVIAPSGCTWMRSEDGQPGYSLMEYKGEQQ